MNDKRILWALVLVQFVVICTMKYWSPSNESKEVKGEVRAEKVEKSDSGAQQLVTRVVEERSSAGDVRTTHETIRTLAFDSTQTVTEAGQTFQSIETSNHSTPRYLLGVTHPGLQAFNPQDLEVSVGFLALDIPTHPVYITTQTNVNLDEFRVGLSIGL